MKILLAVLAICASAPAAAAAPPEKRLALVIGNASYKGKPLATTVNDAALVAQTLRAAGFDVIGARDLDENLLRNAFREFADAVRSAGPGSVAAIYFAGYGLQLEGENYLVPVDTDISDASEVPLRAIRLSEQTRALGALDLKATFMILDMARASPFILSGRPPAGGLAWVEPEANMLIAFNAAPGTIAPDSGNGYGPYARALSEMIREGGRPAAELFDRVRLRVNEFTKGAQLPWDTSDIGEHFMFFERAPNAPQRADSAERTEWMRSQPMRSLDVQDAYMVALMRDTFDGYADFLADYWLHPMTKRVRAILAARREAITWRRTCQANVPDGYWSYLARYPAGAHAADARRRLSQLGAASAPPAKFAMMEYDMPPPLPDELEFVERTALLFNDPALALESPQPSPAYFLEPPPPELLALAPPDAASEAYVLPATSFVPLPVYVELPANVEAPSNSPVLAAEKAPLRSAIDVPAVPNGRPNASSIPSSSARAFLDSPRLPTSVAAKAAMIGGRRLPQLITAKPLPRELVRAAPKPAAVELASAPFWAIYKPQAPKEINTIAAAPTDPWATYYPLAWEATKVPSGARKPWPVANRRIGPAPEDELPVAATNSALAPAQRAAAPPAASLPLPRPATVVPRPIHQRPAPAVAGTPTTEGGQVSQSGVSLNNRARPSIRALRPPGGEPE